MNNRTDEFLGFGEKPTVKDGQKFTDILLKDLGLSSLIEPSGSNKMSKSGSRLAFYPKNRELYGDVYFTLVHGTEFNKKKSTFVFYINGERAGVVKSFDMTNKNDIRQLVKFVKDSLDKARELKKQSHESLERRVQTLERMFRKLKI